MAAAGAGAHASLVSADPAPGAVLAAPPAAIALRFSEPVTAAGAGISVVAPSGRLLPGGPAAAAGREMRAAFHADGQGTYVVRWRVIAADTHPARGQLTFSIGQPTPAPAGEDLAGDLGGASPAGLLLQGLARWLHFLGMALGFGVIAFRVLALPGGAGHGPPAQDRSGRLDRLVTTGIVLLVAAEPAALAGQALSLGVVAGDLLASSFGQVLALRMSGALLLWAGLGAVRQAGRGRPALLAIGAAVALVDGAAGHRVAGLPDVAAFALGGAHEGAMALWAGGLAAALAAPAGARFAPVALASFGVLVLTGAAMAVAHLREPADLVGGAYGAVLAAKVLAVGAGATIAALGARRLEAVALAGVLALAGLLVSLPPPR